MSIVCQLRAAKAWHPATATLVQGLSLELSGVFLAAILAAVPRPGEDEIRRKLDEVLSRPEFSGKQQADWLLAILRWISQFFGWLGSLGETAPLLFWLLLAGCLALLFLLVAHIAWTVRRVFVGGARRARGEKSQQRRQRLSTSYGEEARRRAANRDFTEAIRYLFLSLVYRFDETGRVNFQQAYTNREYLGLFRDRPPVHERLKKFVDTLDDYWYGQRATDRARYDKCLAVYQELAN
jgi:hypothetical protein